MYANYNQYKTIPSPPHRHKLVPPPQKSPTNPSTMSPKLILYGNPVSCSQLHVKVALNEKGITDYTSITVEFVTQENKQPPYLERHPFGKIPAFEDQENGLKLFESRAIARYICAKYADQGTPGLLPDMKDPVAYGIFEQMFSVETCYWDNTTLSIAHEGLYGPK